jgi:predicted transcriptional regulator
MNRTEIKLTDEQHAQLNEVARRKGRSLHEVVHEAVDLFLREVAPDPEAPSEEANEGATAREAPSR